MAQQIINKIIKSRQWLVVFTFILTSCAVIDKKDFNPIEHGYVLGRVSLQADSIKTLQLVNELLISYRKEGNIFYDAFQVQVITDGQDLKQSSYFAYHLKEGTYQINHLNITTPGRVLTRNHKAPITFKIEAGKITNTGELIFEVSSEEGLFGTVFSRNVKVSNRFDEQQKDLNQLYQNSKLAVELPAIQVRLFNNPISVTLVPYQEKNHKFDLD